MDEVALVLAKGEAQVAVHPQVQPLLLLQSQEISSHAEVLIAKGVQSDALVLPGEIQQSLKGVVALLHLQHSQVEVGGVYQILHAIV
jgi:hypothetical protein